VNEKRWENWNELRKSWARKRPLLQYSALVELTYYGGDVLSYDHIRSAISAEIGESASGLTVLSLSQKAINVYATVKGISPLDAITKLDESVLQALMVTGLFEQFDVSRRSLAVGPESPTSKANK
jgi:hypothetical protein